jgi:putative membrane protein
MNETYLWVKAFHLVAVIAWMAALLYLPRLLVYHAELAAGGTRAGPGHDLLATMERRLLHVIATPAMVAVWILGLTLAFWPGMEWFWQENAGWLHVKLALVLGLSALHGIFAAGARHLANGTDRRSPRTYRILNETVTLAMIAIVILVIIKPF